MKKSVRFAILIFEICFLLSFIEGSLKKVAVSEEGGSVWPQAEPGRGYDGEERGKECEAEPRG